jgi:hypothetical protein
VTDRDDHIHQTSAPYHQERQMRGIMGRSAGACAVAVAALLSLHIAQAPAADAERPFNPPVGSRWIIENETSTEDVKPDGPQTSLIKTRAELTIEEKTPDGFRITYVNRGATAEGNSKMVPLVRASVKAMENVAFRATTDRAGKPVRIDNLDEAKAAMRNMVGTLTAPYQDKPQIVAVLNQMMAGLIEVDASKAAEAYIDDVPALAKAQNTGMKLGDIKRSSMSVANPLGGGAAMKSNMAFELTEVDAATGNRKFVNTTSYDAAAMKDFMQSVTKKLMAASGDSTKPEQVDSLVKSMQLSQDERAVFEVEDGMTRKITEKSVLIVRAMGHNLSKTETRSITVTRAP